MVKNIGFRVRLVEFKILVLLFINGFDKGIYVLVFYLWNEGIININIEGCYKY